jgi:diguanylate cyclase (GGDEF)-like protein
LSICVPMMAHGESLGVINFRRNTIETADTDQKLIVAFVEQSALAISNLQLRETLKSQAIRDSLTGLFNRRYFEEAFDRELRRAMRSTFQVAIVMMDVDYFKKFNDSFGHEAGDLILRELGRLLQGYIRGGDVACRFGGEEFILMFPESDLDNAKERACQLSAQIKRITLNYHGQLMGPISVSAGIAGYPSHGHNSESILRSADKALYEAKMSGRDRVGTAPVGA